MRSTLARRLVTVLLGVAMLGSTGLLLLAQAPTTAPAAGQAGAGAASNAGQIMMDIQQASMEMRAALGSPDVVTDPAKRDEAAPKVLPPLKRMIAGAKQLEAAGGSPPITAEQARQMVMQFNVMAATFGDAEARQSLESVAQGGGEHATDGQAALLLVDWFRSNKDAAKQTQILDKAEALAKANPTSNAVTEILMAMTQVGAAGEEIEDRAEKIATGMSSESAQQAKAETEAKDKLEQAKDKPLVIQGATVDGKPFSTADWKGKVILVDFWATWCGPCIAELPRVKKVYADFHDKGLEIIGVSNDQSGQALKEYLSKNPDMPWPQLFDADAAGKGDWHPVTMAHGIEGIPTMFLIDKKGVCRSVTARENFEEMIPKLLAEPE